MKSRNAIIIILVLFCLSAITVAVLYQKFYKKNDGSNRAADAGLVNNAKKFEDLTKEEKIQLTMVLMEQAEKNNPTRILDPEEKKKQIQITIGLMEQAEKNNPIK